MLKKIVFISLVVSSLISTALALTHKMHVDDKLVANTKWCYMDSSLTAKKIKIYDPPPTLGVRGAFIEVGVKPTFEDISSGDYLISRSLFVYLKDSHAVTTPESSRQG